MDELALSRRSLFKSLAAVSLASLSSKIPLALSEVGKTPPIGLPLQYVLHLGTHLGLDADGTILLTWSTKDDAWITGPIVGSGEFEGLTFRWVLVVICDPSNFRESSATAFPEMISGRDIHGICEKRSDYPPLIKF